MVAYIVNSASTLRTECIVDVIQILQRAVCDHYQDRVGRHGDIPKDVLEQQQSIVNFVIEASQITTRSLEALSQLMDLSQNC